jgi:hypothetical protein
VSLADRIRGVLQTPNSKGRDRAGTAPRLPIAFLEPGEHTVRALDAVLGGQWHQLEGGACYLVETRRNPASVHGGKTLGGIAERLAGSLEEAGILAGHAVRPPFVFFDLETTGLSGGAGTCVFLIGCGWFDEEGGFATRQYLLVRIADERPLLGLFSSELNRAGTLVSFNGKSFDAPLLETRYLYHRLPWPGGPLPHVDMLHVARRLWGTAGPGCSLSTLEQQVLGTWRRGDVPGVEIPSRYFHFVRTGDASPLEAVLEHNRLDLLSLAALTIRALDIVRMGPDHVAGRPQSLALGHIYSRAGMVDHARASYLKAAAVHSVATDGCVDGMTGARGAELPLRVAALRALARTARRARRFEEAASYWRAIFDLRECPPHILREAGDALAIHHEHRLRDFPAAKIFALGTMTGVRPARNDAIRHRLARIERKMSVPRQLVMVLE